MTPSLTFALIQLRVFEEVLSKSFDSEREALSVLLQPCREQAFALGV